MSLKGSKAFRRCDVKVVEFTRYVKVKDSDLIVAQGESREKLKLGEDTPIYLAGFGAVLHCPRTEDDRIKIESTLKTHDSQISALESIRELAGGLLCRECRFSTMTPVEVSVERQKLAAAEAERVEAATRLQQAYVELDAVIEQRNILGEADS